MKSKAAAEDPVQDWEAIEKRRMSPMFLVHSGRVIFKTRRVSNGGKKGRAKKVCAQSGPEAKRGEEIDASEIGGAEIHAEIDAEIRAQSHVATNRRTEIRRTEICR